MGRFVAVIFLVLAGGGAFAQFRDSRNTNPPGDPAPQDNTDPNPFSKIYFGGGGGFGFGTSAYGYTYNYYSLFPIIGYRVNSQASIGTGLSYQRFNYPGSGLSSYSQYGISPFFRYNVNPLFFQAEYDLINAPVIDNNTGTPTLSRGEFSRMLFGIGYSIPAGRKSFINALVMYDVLYRQPSVFNSPIVVRVFFIF